MDARRGAADCCLVWGRRFSGAAALIVIILGAANGGLVRYDQSQTGDYNVHVDMKNVDILAFLDDSALGFGEYDYDYGDMTLKPPPVPGSHNTSLPAAALADASSTEKADDSSTASDGSSSTTVPSTTKPTRRCGAGFFRDQMGRCRRQRRPIRLSSILNQAKNSVGG